MSKRVPVRLAIAVFGGAAGVALYALLRADAAMFLPSGWHRPLAHGLPAWLLGPMPTFLHALTLSLLTLVAIGPAGRTTAAAVCAAWFAAEAALELAQHAEVASALLARWPCEPSTCAPLRPLAAFVSHGRFDPLDIAAAALGCLIAFGLTRPGRPVQESAHA